MSKNDEFVLKTRNFVSKTRTFGIKNEEFCIENDELCSKKSSAGKKDAAGNPVKVRFSIDFRLFFDCSTRIWVSF